MKPSGVVFYHGRGLQSTSEAYREALGQPWVPKGDFEAIWEAPLGGSWAPDVHKPIIILTISVKMCVSPTREHNFEAWGSPGRLKTVPPKLKVLL